jgi:acetolactate synthase-1/2/3 large subunit
MNNCAFGTIAGLQLAHYGTTVGTLFFKDGAPFQAYVAAIARAYGAEGVKVTSAEEFKPVLERTMAANKPFVIDVSMQTRPSRPSATGTSWTYSPGKKSAPRRYQRRGCRWKTQLTCRAALQENTFGTQ